MEMAETVSLALLMILESLTPAERAAFLLRRVFDYGYDEISAILEKSAPNCRQLVHRAEQAIEDRRRARSRSGRGGTSHPGFFASLHQRRRARTTWPVVRRRRGVQRRWWQGDGRASAGARRHRAARFFVGVTKKTPADAQVQHARVNGQPGIVIFVAGKAVTVLTLDVIDGRIVTCYAIRNPEICARQTGPGGSHAVIRRALVNAVARHGDRRVLTIRHIGPRICRGVRHRAAHQSAAVARQTRILARGRRCAR